MVKSPFVGFVSVSSTVAIAIAVTVAVIAASIVGVAIVAVVAAVVSVVIMLMVMGVVDLNMLLLVSGLWHLDDINGWDFDDLGHFFLNYTLVSRGVGGDAGLILDACVRVNVGVVSIIAVSVVISSSDVSVLGVAMVAISVVSIPIAMMSIMSESTVVAVSTEAVAGGVVTIELVGIAREAISLVAISVVPVMSVVTVMSVCNLDESMLSAVVAMLGAIDCMDRWNVLIGVEVITRILRAILNSINEFGDFLLGDTVDLLLDVGSHWNNFSHSFGVSVLSVVHLWLVMMMRIMVAHEGGCLSGCEKQGNLEEFHSYIFFYPRFQISA